MTVSAAATKLEASAGSLAATADRSSELIAAVTAASHDASANVQSVAAATEEMASSVTEISRQVQQSALIASDAVTQAQLTDLRIGKLAKAASRIGDVVEIINTIARPTNLLALNATIEAARAGVAGRGFAVVAAEVKTLAEQTAKATGEISAQVSDIQSATSDLVSSIKEIRDTIVRMSQISFPAIASSRRRTGSSDAGDFQKCTARRSRYDAGVVEYFGRPAGCGRDRLSLFACSIGRPLAFGENGRLKVEVEKLLNSVRAA